MNNNETQTSEVVDTQSNVDITEVTEDRGQTSSNQMKKLNNNTFAGIALTVLFIAFSFVNNINIRWWVMVPIALGAAWLFYHQMQQSEGDEKKICFYGLWVIGAAFVIRDAYFTHQIANMIDGLRDMSHQFQNLFHSRKG